jgi:hypothetical protein
MNKSQANVLISKLVDAQATELSILERELDDFALPRVVYRYDTEQACHAVHSGNIWLRSFDYLRKSYDGEIKADGNEGDFVSYISRMDSGDGDFVTPLIEVTNSRCVTVRNCIGIHLPPRYAYVFCTSTRFSMAASRRFGENLSCLPITRPHEFLSSLIASCNESHLPLQNATCDHVVYQRRFQEYTSGRKRAKNQAFVKPLHLCFESEYRFLLVFKEPLCDPDTLKLNIKYEFDSEIISTQSLRANGNKFRFYSLGHENGQDMAVDREPVQ